MLAAITSEMADIVRRRAWNASRQQSRKPFSLLRGTKGSNPSLSSGESGTNRRGPTAFDRAADRIGYCVTRGRPCRRRNLA
jgi:hypothetical protein